VKAAFAARRRFWVRDRGRSGSVALGPAEGHRFPNSRPPPPQAAQLAAASSCEAERQSL